MEFAANHRVAEPRRRLDMNKFTDLALCTHQEVQQLLELAKEFTQRPPPARLQNKVLGLLFFNPSLRTLTSFQTAMARLGGSSWVVTPGQGTWQLQFQDGIPMTGEAAEHVREALPVLSGYCDVLGIRLFSKLNNLAADLADTEFNLLASLVDKPVINLESAMNHPCQALADWKTLDDMQIPAHGKLVLSWAYHPRPLPLAVPAAILHMAARRGMEVVVLRPEGFGLPSAVMEHARSAASISGGSVSETSDSQSALKNAQVIYAKEWAGTLAYEDPALELQSRSQLQHRWCVNETWFENTAKHCRLMHCLPVRRDSAVASSVLDGPRSAVLQQAQNRLTVQTALLQRLLHKTSSTH
jgi:N-acetylornithine carbamoyltransferase